MKYKVNNHLRHNGKKYNPGDIVEIKNSHVIFLLLKFNTVSEIKGGDTPPVPDEYKNYASKTNDEQINLIKDIEDKEELKQLLPYSKSKAKKEIEKKLKEPA